MAKNLVTIRDAHLREAGEKDAWSALRAIGSQGVEIAVEPDLSCPNIFGEKPYSIKNADETKRLADDAKAQGLVITSFCTANKFDEAPEREIQLVVDVANAAKAIGAGAIRLDVVPRKLQADVFLPFAIQTCKAVVEKTADTGVKFGIENHGPITNRVEFLERLFDGVGSDRMGLTLDTGNFYWFGYPLDELYVIYRKFAPRTCHTHVKSIAYPEDRRNTQRPVGWEYGKYNSPLYDGDIDFKKVVAILREAGYKGDLCIENESLAKFPKDKRRDVLAKEVAFLKAL